MHCFAATTVSDGYIATAQVLVLSATRIPKMMPFPLLLLQRRQEPTRNSNSQEHCGTPEAVDKCTQRVSTAPLKSPHQEGQPQCSYATATVAASGTSKPTSSTAVQIHYRQDKKFNVIVYGVKECPKGTPKHAQSQSDFRSVVSVLSNVQFCQVSIYRGCVSFG